MIITKSQNNFSRGQINPRLQSRDKEVIYEYGVLEATNCFLEPSGILKKRYGTKFIESLTSYGTVFRLAEFAYSVDFNYLLVFYPNKVRIYQNSNFIISLDTIFDISDIPNLRWDQFVDTMIVCDGVHKPQQILLATPLLTWSISDYNFIEYPTYDFNKNYFNITFTPSAAYGTVTITASANIFTSDLVGGIFSAFPCFARITGFTDATHITVVTLIDTYFFTGEGNPTGTVKPIDGRNVVMKEPAWSDLRGWPTNPRVFNNRLWFGGSKSRPQNVWGSVIGQYDNFDEGTGLPDKCVNINISSQQLNTIKHLTSSNKLIVLTNTINYVLITNNDGSLSFIPESYEGIK